MPGSARSAQTTLSWIPIGKLLGVDRRTVRSHRNTFAQHGNVIGMGGRPAILTEGQMDLIVRFMTGNCKARRPWRINEIGRWIRHKFGIYIIPNALHHIISRDPRINSCRAIPMDRK
jgi:hypothetical protein